MDQRVHYVHLMQSDSKGGELATPNHFTDWGGTGYSAYLITDPLRQTEPLVA